MMPGSHRRPLQGEELRLASHSTDASRPAGHHATRACAGVTPDVWFALLVASGLAWLAIALVVVAVVWSA